MFAPATIKERRQYYREEWSEKDLPNFISEELYKREFGFDHYGKGPNDRYKVFKNKDSLKKFMRIKAPFAGYVSVAFYNNPQRRGDWIKSEFVFDVDAKDMPIRSCNCESVCKICLGEALEFVQLLIDTLKTDLGIKNIHLIYSGRGYHVRILDPAIMETESELRGEVVKYVVGANVPENSISLGYTNLFNRRVKRNIFHLTGHETLDGINSKLLKDTIKHRDLLKDNSWGLFKGQIGPIRYKNLLAGMARVNLSMVDAKVSIDLKRILRLPSSLHSKVSMKCVEVKNPETFDPFKYAVPKFVHEREEKNKENVNENKKEK
ncbi:DNA primase catalytic subunit PriS [Methanobrevibacter filiformis]|uniref:DNA primase catalytic subunit PriS n=1 Tax=Methanobrevibacter filiformis TaxID=55758 RepID=UPI0008338F1E|nr:DNA primase catalytic subunit PriS [Methanobrevibacter filiformis]